MASDWANFLSREELLGGLPARRASTLLYAIESRTAHLLVRTRQAMTSFLVEKTAEANERAFLEAVGQGRDLPVQPTIQDLERYADEWAPLVPADPGVRATLARMIGDKYVVPQSNAPMLRRALGLDQAEVAEAFERLHDRPVNSLYAARPSWRERWRWFRARLANRLESLSPFWSAFALTLTGTIGTSMLALPIAAANVGPVTAVMVLLGLGVVNILTIAAMSEAVSRNGGIRYGSAYLGRVVTDYLGGTGVAIFTIASLLACGVALLVRGIGLATTMSSSIGLPTALWAALLLVVNVYFIRLGSLDSSVATTLLVGAGSVLLILALALLALPHLHTANLGYRDAPFFGDGSGSFDRAGAGLIFGVALSIFQRQVSVGSTAKVVLGRDPSGRSLLWGNVAALAVSAVLCCLWIAAVNGAVTPSVLASEQGTALGPLADVSGPASRLFGGLFVVLSMGMGSIYMSLVLFQYVRDLLPAHDRAAAPPAPAARSGVHLTSVANVLRRRRLSLSVAPVVAVFLIVEWLLLTGQESFTKPIAFVNAIIGPVLVGIFPMLLLVASRRRGEHVPATVFGFLGHPLVVGGVYVASLAALFAHALIIWDAPAQRAVGLLAGAAMVGVNIDLVRRGSFRPRAVVEVRVDQRAGSQGVFSVTAAGHATPTDIQLTLSGGERRFRQATGSLGVFHDLRAADFDMRTAGVRELSVWAHEITLDGESQALPAAVTLSCGDGARQHGRNLGDNGEQAHFTLDDGSCRVHLSFPHSGRASGDGDRRRTLL